MKIVIDGRWISKPAGLGIMTRELVSHLAQEDHENIYVVYISRLEDRDLVPKNNSFSFRVIPGPYPFAEQVMIPLALISDKPDIFHAALGTAPVLLPRTKLVVTLADVMFLMPEHTVPKRLRLYQKFGSLYRKLVVPIAFRKAKAVATISEKSRQDIKRYFGDTKKVDVIYLAQGQDFTPPKEEKSEDPYAFSLSATDPRKYTRELVRAYTKAKIKTPLVLAGSLEESLSKSLDPKITYIGRVDQKKLIELYQGAKFFIYPSLYEAFGIPLLEAMACGAPVLALTTGANREIAGNAAYLVDEKNLERALVKMDTDKNFRNSLREDGFLRSKDFSWTKTAKHYLEVYKRV